MEETQVAPEAVVPEAAPEVIEETVPDEESIAE